MIKSLIISNFLILLLITVSFAQQDKYLPPRQIAFYNKYKFEDDKIGIVKLTKAILFATDRGYIGDLSNPKLKAIYEETYKKRYKILVEPVENEISALIRQIETQNNLMILDLVELDNNGQILEFDEKLDISDPLTVFFNEYFKTKSKPNLLLNLSESKIGAINTESFYDKKSGIKRLTVMFAEKSDQLKKETGTTPTFEEIKARIFKDKSKSKIFQQIGNSIQSYMMEQGFGVVFDSSKQIPKELETFQTQDITNNFISYYNQIYP